MIAAAIDVGTNSIKLAVAGLGENNTLDIVMESSTNARLGRGVDAHGRIYPESIIRSQRVVESHVLSARHLGADAIRVVTTSAARDAVNRDELVSRFMDELGIPLEILSEDDECRYSYMSVALDDILGRNTQKMAMVDVGGGSSEFAFGEGCRIDSGRSVKIGAVRLTERFFSKDPPSINELESAADYIREAIGDEIVLRHVSRLVGVGGTAVNLARIWKKVPPEETFSVHGTMIAADEIESLVDHLHSLSRAERSEIVGLEPDRADVILAGSLILRESTRMMKSPALTVSVRGLRHGVLYEMLKIGCNK